MFKKREITKNFGIIPMVDKPVDPAWPALMQKHGYKISKRMQFIYNHILLKIKAYAYKILHGMKLIWRTFCSTFITVTILT